MSKRKTRWSMASPVGEGPRSDDRKIRFSVEEFDGTCLDLEGLFLRYIKSKFGLRLFYQTYVEQFPGIDDLHVIPPKYKSTFEYKDYLQDILDYLVSFLERTRPSSLLDPVLTNADEELENELDRRRRKRPRLEELIVKTGVGVDVDVDVDKLMALGLDKLKEILDSSGLKCGGTLRQRAERLLVAINTPADNLGPKRLKKVPPRDIVLLEMQVTNFVTSLRMYWTRLKCTSNVPSVVRFTTCGPCLDDGHAI